MRFKKSFFVISFFIGLKGPVCYGQNYGSSRFASLVGSTICVHPAQKRMMSQWLPSSCNKVLNVCKTYPVSVSLFAVHLCVYAAQLYYSYVKDVDLIMKFGQLNKAVQRGQGWRLCTSMFLHNSLLHLAMNNYFLIKLSPLEQRLGSKKFLGFYITSGILANFFSYLIGKPHNLSVGSSGALYGLFGVCYGRAIKQGNASYKDFAFSVAKCLAPGFLVSILGDLPPLDNVAHVSGLASGYVLGKTLAD